jgi:sirohydrochlorin ferrochelatase
LRVAPNITTLLDRVQAQSPEDILLFPLFFGQSTLVSKELPDQVRRVIKSPICILPAAGDLPGLARMLASRITARLASNGCHIAKTAVFLISHGRKSDIVPASNLIEIRKAIAEITGTDEIHNVQLEGAAALTKWRDMTRLRKALFIPLMAGDGEHCLHDVPEAVKPRIGEHIDILAPVGTWWELSSLLAEYVNFNWLSCRCAYGSSRSSELGEISPCHTED